MAAIVGSEGLVPSCRNSSESRPRKFGRARTRASAAMTSKFPRSRTNLLRLWQAGRASSKLELGLEIVRLGFIMHALDSSKNIRINRFFQKHFSPDVSIL